jgi:hypothetical protein
MAAAVAGLVAVNRGSPAQSVDAEKTELLRSNEPSGSRSKLYARDGRIEQASQARLCIDGGRLRHTR